MEQDTSKFKYIAYMRKSTEGEERQVLSIPAQRDKLKEYFPNLKIIEWVDEQKSAFEPYNRPKFEKVLERIQNGEADGIIAWHPNRLSRNEVDAGSVTYMIRKGVLKDLKFCSYNFDNSPEGIWMLQMALSQGQYESAKLSKEVKRGNEQKLKAGGPTGMVPSGYLNNISDHSAIPDPDRFHLVRQMWDLMLTGDYAVPQIAKIANEKWGYISLKRRKSGGVSLNPSTLYAIFRNQFYAGVIVRNGVEYNGVHEAMITLEQFDRVQMLLGTKGRPRAKIHELYYTGYMFCGECGCRITAEEKFKFIKSTKEMRRYVYYHCTRKRKNFVCSQNRHLEETKLEEQMKTELMKYAILPNFRDWGLKALNSRHLIEVEDRSKVYEMQHKSVVQAQAQLDNIDDMVSRGAMEEDRYAKKSVELKAKIEKLEGELRETEQRAKSWQAVFEKTLATCAYAADKFNNGDWRTRRAVLLEIGHNPTLTDRVFKLTPEDWFQPIANQYPAIEAEYKKVITAKYANSTDKNKALASVYSKWQELMSDLRTFDSNRNTVASIKQLLDLLLKPEGTAS